MYFQWCDVIQYTQGHHSCLALYSCAASKFWDMGYMPDANTVISLLTMWKLTSFILFCSYKHLETSSCTQGLLVRHSICTSKKAATRAPPTHSNECNQLLYSLMQNFKD